MPVEQDVYCENCLLTIGAHVPAVVTVIVVGDIMPFCRVCFEDTILPRREHFGTRVLNHVTGERQSLISYVRDLQLQ